MVWESAIESLRVHKLRSALTLLGLVVGVAAVLTINVFGQVTREVVARQFGALGATLVSVAPQIPPPPPGAVPGVPVKFGADSPGPNSPGPKPVFPADLNEKDLQAIRALPHVNAAALHGVVPQVQAIANGQNGQTDLIGATPDFQTVMGYTLTSGEFISEQDEAARANVVVIGAAVARLVYPDQDPVGQSVQLNNIPFTIKGVLASQGSNGEMNLDETGVVPYSVLDRLRGNNRMFALSIGPIGSSGVLLQADDVRNIPAVETSTIQLIQQLHPSKPGELPYAASDFAQAVQIASQSTSTIRLALIGVAVVALLLGTFGLFSIMTMSVTERTREIGLRMAVGARERDIMLQFLVEATVLSLVGGGAGALLGSGLSALAPRVAGPLGGMTALPEPAAIAAVVLGSIILGAAFGLAPARRAAHLDPASALRRA
jgi:putative ABC transport system permease protein